MGHISISQERLRYNKLIPKQNGFMHKFQDGKVKLN